MISFTPGLDAIASAYKRLNIKLVNTEQIAYQVRQINVAVGCDHGCSHCFASPPAEKKIMALEGFTRLAMEFGWVAHNTGVPYDFLFLGSATDPSAVPEFARYLTIWLDAVGDVSPTRIYTHGWLLPKPQQSEELENTANVLAHYVDAIEMVNISIDCYSSLARHDSNAYEKNIATNIRRLIEAVGPNKVRFHILYPIERQGASSTTLIGSQIGRNFDEVLAAFATLTNPNDRACAKLTAIVLRIGKQVGFDVDETVAHSRDAGIPMVAGRAVTSLRNASLNAREEGLAWYRRKALPRLRETVGLQIFPNGSVRIIDYDGYKNGPWLNHGDKVVNYLEVVR